MRFSKRNISMPHINQHKVAAYLINHSYMQNYIGMFAALFCASIIFISLFETGKSNTPLFIWAGVFLAITLMRIIATLFYKRKKPSEMEIMGWRYFYIIGAWLGGMVWGCLPIFFFPFASDMQQMLIILMLAGVTAGSVPLSAAVPSAEIGFLTFSLMPLIVAIVSLHDPNYLIFDATVVLYLIYSITLVIKTYRLIKNSVVLQFENDLLLNNLEVSNKKLEYAATHDPLTQLANRRLFMLNLKSALTSSVMHQKPLALFYIDLDHFKEANDRHGHEAGDTILIAVTERLKNYFRKEDIIARLGGDELAVIVENISSRNEVEIIAKKMCSLIALPIEMNQVALNVTASIGISIFPQDGFNEETILRAADQCMYTIKEKGGNHFYMNPQIKEMVFVQKVRGG